jgi:hypothetical protein
MTIKELKKIIRTIPEEAIILIDAENMTDVETISAQYHSDGRVHLILSIEE